MEYEDIKRANESIGATKLKNKKTGKELGDYVEVNKRIKAFRMLLPEGFIKTEIIKLENGVCVMKARVGYYEVTKSFDNTILSSSEVVLGTGTAYEVENSTFINSTSYIENCETSAVGRALAMMGIGIEKSIASREEVENAINNQVLTESQAKEITFGGSKHPGETILDVYEKGDTKFLNWYLNKEGMNEEIKKAIELLTPLKRIPIPSEEEQERRLYLINEIMTKKDVDEVKAFFQVNDLTELTTEQMESVVNDN